MASGSTVKVTTVNRRTGALGRRTYNLRVARYRRRGEVAVSRRYAPESRSRIIPF